ncbi:hypothetical protein TTHT_0041 [Thermotomaculum hydrothermale]|uniref:PpiC domain-containing protein n=1 Tax=Thermotomaculum hydrothermale TaxID=981385 RepID=A0A7R6SXE4_9BACT|nr:peptidylprolyl isomerase [Thermotomaculum hydrothermale]BBB31694.1 hypothetical protein TTHT_0041 [Thermotomaculum hydrothermale]
MKRFLVGLTLTILIISGVSCGKKSRKPPVPENVIATIDKYYVFRDEFLLYLNLNYKPILEKKDSFILSRILDDYLKRRMIYLYLKEKNMLPSNDAIVEYMKFHGFDRIYKKLDLKNKRYFVFFMILNLNEEIMKNHILKDYVHVDEKEIKDYYENRTEEFIKKKTYCFTRFHSSYKDLMVEARRWIVRKHRDETFIRLRYRDIEVEENCFEEDNIPEDFLKILKKMRPNRVSKVIKLKIGEKEDYNILWLKKVIPARKLKFEEVKDMIYNKIAMEKYSKKEEEIYSEINKKFKVIVYPENILVFKYNGVFPVFNSEGK